VIKGIKMIQLDFSNKRTFPEIEIDTLCLQDDQLWAAKKGTDRTEIDKLCSGLFSLGKPNIQLGHRVFPQLLSVKGIILCQNQIPVIDIKSITGLSITKH